LNVRNFDRLSSGKFDGSNAGSANAADDVGKLRTPEFVKAYPVGRYTDPNLPNQMHERHTLYRREHAADWNYRPSKA
jgi:hypothetical protein